MTPNEYQQLASRTLIDAPDRTYTLDERAAIVRTLELMVTFGNLVEQIKKEIFHSHGFSIVRYASNLSALMAQADMCLRLATTPLMPSEDILTSPKAIMKFWNAFGLVGEACEVAEVCRAEAESDVESTNSMTKELGDISWYTAALASKSGLTMLDILSANIKKLMDRYPDGYSSEASKNRSLTDM